MLRKAPAKRAKKGILEIEKGKNGIQEIEKGKMAYGIKSDLLGARLKVPKRAKLGQN